MLTTILNLSLSLTTPGHSPYQVIGTPIGICAFELWVSMVRSTEGAFFGTFPQTAFGWHGEIGRLVHWRD